MSWQVARKRYGTDSRNLENLSTTQLGQASSQIGGHDCVCGLSSTYYIYAPEALSRHRSNLASLPAGLKPRGVSMAALLVRGRPEYLYQTSVVSGNS